MKRRLIRIAVVAMLLALTLAVDAEDKLGFEDSALPVFRDQLARIDRDVGGPGRARTTHHRVRTG